MATSIPAWARTLGAMIDNGTTVQVYCSTCRVFRRLTLDDMRSLAEKVGRDYSLVNRRCRCRLTPGCRGWNKFQYLLGVMRNLADPNVADRWGDAEFWEKLGQGSVREDASQVNDREALIDPQTVERVVRAMHEAARLNGAGSPYTNLEAMARAAIREIEGER